MPTIDEDKTVTWNDDELNLILEAEEAAAGLVADLGSIAVPTATPFTCDSVVDRWGQAMDHLDKLVGLMNEFALWKFNRPKKTEGQKDGREE